MPAPSASSTIAMIVSRITPIRVGPFRGVISIRFIALSKLLRVKNSMVRARSHHTAIGYRLSLVGWPDKSRVHMGRGLFHWRARRVAHGQPGFVALKVATVARDFPLDRVRDDRRSGDFTGAARFGQNGGPQAAHALNWPNLRARSVMAGDAADGLGVRLVHFEVKRVGVAGFARRRLLRVRIVAVGAAIGAAP